MKKRIIGIDVARAFAIIVMVIVNFKIALGSVGMDSLQSTVGLLEGKAAAIFVVLAGAGIAFMSNAAVQNNDTPKLKKVQFRLFKRAIFLFVIGLLFIPIWPADILHFYGIYMLLPLILLASKRRTILAVALMLILAYPFMMLTWEYSVGWNFDTLEYPNFWSVEGFFRNLFYNGFHPVIPWAAFMLVGFWFGKNDLNDPKFIKKSAVISFAILKFTVLLSLALLFILSDGDAEVRNELKQILGRSPMPPLPIYMITGSSFAIFIISICVILSKKFENSKVISALQNTGQLALTFYAAHVIIGMGLIELIDPAKMGKYSTGFSVLYAIGFSLSCILFAVIWKKYQPIGPLEWVMRKLTG
jgi:uncharacterized protein